MKPSKEQGYELIDEGIVYPDRKHDPFVMGDTPQVLKRELFGKQVEVVNYKVFHEGVPPANLVTAYASHDMRTSESLYGSIPMYIRPGFSYPGSPSGVSLIGLGRRPLYKPETIARTVQNPTVFGSNPDYFSTLDHRFPDIRGVDQYEHVDIVDAIMYKRRDFDVPSLPLSGLSEKEVSMASRMMAIYMVNTLRDNIQAYYIAKILKLATETERSVSLGHIGGVFHTALPMILKGYYGIPTQSYSVDGAQPTDLVKIFTLCIPPREVLAALVSVDKAQISWDTPRIVELLDPVLSFLPAALRPYIEQLG
ncbi:hypothetical protein KBD81_01000 [Candidatus Woesebacteria bacterium]|nr:hypothetical protein [Candidatus Woesebacteria bacterium]